MNEKVAVSADVQTSLLAENRPWKRELKEHDFIWITDEAGCETALPLQIQNVQQLETSGFIQTDQGWIHQDQIQGFYKDERWLKNLASEWLMNAVLSRFQQEERLPYAVLETPELRVLTGQQQAIIRWYMSQHREVKAVSFEQEGRRLRLRVEFCFLQKKIEHTPN